MHVSIFLTAGFGTCSCQSCPRSALLLQATMETLWPRDGKRKHLLLDAALDTDTREGIADPRQDRSKMCVELRILISDQEILMCIHKNIPLEMRLKPSFSPSKLKRLRSWEFNSGPDFKTCYLDQRLFQLPIQSVQFGSWLAFFGLFFFLTLVFLRSSIR